MSDPSNFSDHFSSNAGGYAAHRPTYPQVLADYLASTCAQHGRVWDCGCGSGQFSSLLADRFDCVVATDASAAQIDMARPHPRIEYACAPAENCPLPDASVDLVVAAQAAHWFDLDAFYGEAGRVGCPGSMIALITYGLVTIEPSIDRIVKRFYTEVLGPYWPAERRHVENGYADLAFPFEQWRAPDLEIDMAWTLADFLGYVATWSAVRRLENDQGPAYQQQFEQDMAQAWGDGEHVRRMRWPLSLRVGRLVPTVPK